ncbi:MAG: diaminobutyrate decarboxylase, partial [Sphaerochaetaceae bacterium]|nr:diaminobutyrate decarboxylase [Sphaerochaetaceae bacterium]
MTEPLILSTKEEDSLRFREMMEKTIDSIVSSSKKEGAFSGINPNTLREKIEALDFLPQEGIGFDRTLSKVEEEILPHLLRTWSPRYMPHLHAPALTETIASELLIASFNDSMDSWD